MSEPGSGIAQGLRFAATPTFAVMALLTTAGAPPDVLCMASHASPFSGMVPMYLLMSAFHCGPWVTLLARRSKIGLVPSGRRTEAASK